MLFIVNCVHTCKIDCVVTVMKCIDSNNVHVGIPLFNLICTYLNTVSEVFYMFMYY